MTINMDKIIQEFEKKKIFKEDPIGIILHI